MAQLGNSTIEDWTLNPPTHLKDAVNTIIACLAVLVNGMVITVMLLRRRVFSSFTNRLILHQSFIDSIAGVIFFLHLVVIKTKQISVSVEGSMTDQFFCRLVYSDVMLWCVNITSTYNLVMISLERFMATCHPVKHRNSSSAAKLKFAVGIAWAIGFIFGLHIIFMFEPRQGYCQFIEMETALKVFEATMVVVIECLMPFTILIYTYSRIIITLTKKSAPMNGPQNAVNKAKRNILVTTMLIGIMFAVCWTPLEVLFIYEQFSGDWSTPLYDPFTTLVACNMFVNPIIYFFKYNHFRSELRQLIQKLLRRNRVGDGNGNPPTS
ncbi:neuropeptide receptor 22-like [Patiria miniata]|uniref:G-protein coupled receptors family 1 profile domain-containing protein n=1 Tax=Patiria miniata TaxID=46514 RepID=A0A914AZX6_PATMI|nr:neuropeptide receptor 22-like [Patiria miniata]